MSNTITTLNALRTRAEEIKPLADQLAAMQAAVTEMARITADMAVLEARLSEEQDAARLAASSAARFQITSVSTSDTYAGPMSSYVVRFTERVSGIDGRPDIREGAFSLIGLSQEVYDALLADEKKLPAVVRALGETPAQAIHEYACNMRRGYMRG